MNNILVTGVGSYLPKKIISNNDLPIELNTSDEWIKKRTGIRQRHIVSKNEKAIATMWESIGPGGIPRFGVSMSQGPECGVVSTREPVAALAAHTGGRSDRRGQEVKTKYREKKAKGKCHFNRETEAYQGRHGDVNCIYKREKESSAGSRSREFPPFTYFWAKKGKGTP